MKDHFSEGHGAWRKSTHSGQGESTCVEVAEMSRGLAVRDSTDPAGPQIAFRAQSWHRFMTRLKQPE
jgi:hypothetical protein